MVSLKIEWDVDSLKPWRTGKIDDALFFAAKRAGGDAIRKARTEAKREIRKRKTVKDHRIHKALFLDYPEKAKTLADLEWRLRFADRPFPLTYFKYRQLKSEGTVKSKTTGKPIRRKRNAGVEVEVNVGEKETLRHAFIAKMRSGYVGIFQRLGKKRKPIEALFSSRVSDVAADLDFMPIIKRKAQAEFNSTVGRLFAMRMAKL